MRKSIVTFSVLLLNAAALCSFLLAQTPQRSSPAGPSASSSVIEHAVDLAGSGHCPEALKILKRSTLQSLDKELKYSAQMAKARCAMSLNDQDAAVQALLVLNREFPDDPQVLFVSTHYYSELAGRAAQRIAAVAPKSHQAHQLEAEAFESQGKWDDAEHEYKVILQQNPQVPGIHYRLARIALSRPQQTPELVEEGRKELEDELKVDPRNASAVFFLGELSRQAAQWDDAIARFSKAAELDPGFAEAFLALGMTYNSASRFQDAVAPLERYVKLVPADPAGHYQLSIAYARTGRKQDAVREMNIQQQLTQQKESGGGAPPTQAPPN